jgi:hypothetical protein
MPYLGVVLGSILAELTQARRVADALTRELIDQYRADPRLAAMSVPRAILSDVTINLKFQVRDVETAPVLSISPDRLGALWSATFREKVMPQLLDRFKLSPAEEAQVVSAITTDLRAREIRQRFRVDEATSDSDRGRVETGGIEPVVPLRAWELTFETAVLEAATVGDRAPLAQASVKLVADSWTQIPTDVRAKLGTKAAFTAQLAEIVDAELVALIDEENARAEIVAALRSRIDVLVKGEEIVDPARIQTLTITLRGSDVEAVMTHAQRNSE